MQAPASARITAIGMVTPAGFGAHASCAAIRAGLARFAELPALTIPGDDGVDRPVVGSTVHGVTDGTRGLGRITPLCAGAIRDLLQGAALPPSALPGVRFYITLPPAERPAVDPRLGRDLGDRIERWCRLKGAAARTSVFQGGQAAMIEAIAAAIGDLGRGAVTAAAVGGVDTLVEPETVRFLHAEGRLKTPDRPVGIMPGEGAAFLLLEAPARAKARGARALASIEAPSTAVEPVTIASRDPCDGSGLSAALHKTLSSLHDKGEQIGLLLTDLNGEPYRAEELGYAMTRSLVHLRSPIRLFHAADCIGDTGAASCAIAAAAGARALHQGYARTRGALLTASSDGGLRGAAYLCAADKEE